MKFSRAIILMGIISSCQGQNNAPTLKTNIDNNTLLWEISGKGLRSPSYLFGTFHLLCSNDIHFSASLKKALKNAKELYLELDMDDPSMMLSAMTLVNMNKGEKLTDLYSPAEYERVEHFFKDSLGSSLTLFQNMKPAFLEAMLYPKMMPCKTISGVEEELMKLAKEDKKEIQGLETMAFQASVFDSIPYTEQARELLKTIDSINSYKKYFDTMTRIYNNQQLKEIENMFSKSEFGMEENQDILLNNRNKNWIGQLKTIMKKEPVFVAVGAGHLVGEQGLIALLRKEGYVLRPIENK
jgi:uncharacterized protein YbaP (TraB family)